MGRRPRPVNWPLSFTYSPTSVYTDLSANLLKNFLSSPNPADHLHISPVIEEGRVHPHLQILKITKTLEYKGPKPHPLAELEAFAGHTHCGLFAINPIPKETELGEYVGEISIGQQEESGTRGVHCWHAQFRDFWVNISSERICNELAFANDFRGLQAAPNARIKWILHRGSYYFGFETIQAIEAGEEILVDYGKTWEKKLCRKGSDHSLSQPCSTRGASSQGGHEGRSLASKSPKE
ncbi:MAG: hypothetical protein JSS32_01705 [Verrucomicrobia bacterium]|nr:hypothetical protein [Verrucomicrobiota bacterium]